MPHHRRQTIALAILLILTVALSTEAFFLKRWVAAPQSRPFDSNPDLSIGGVVRNIAGKPVAKASVQVQWLHTSASGGDNWISRELTTAANGRWSLPGLGDFDPAKINLTVQIRHSRYASLTAAGDHLNGLFRNSAVFTLDRGVPLAGVVLDQQGKPVQGLQIIATSDYSKPAVTGADGKFSIAHLLPGQSQIRGYAPKKGYAYLEVNIIPNMPGITLTAIPGVTITGTITDKQSKTVAGALVYCVGNSGSRKAQTNDAGKFEIADVDPKSEQIIVIWNNNKRQNVKFTAGQKVVDIRLDPAQ